MSDIRLIDANALKRQAVEVEIVTPPHNHYCSELVVFGYDIDEAPTVDAVEVVRCREFKKRGHDWECPLCWMEWHDDKTQPGAGCFEKKDETEDDGFCHKGAKMDGGAEP